MISRRDRMLAPSRRALLAAVPVFGLLGLSACDRNGGRSEKEGPPQPDGPPEGSLEWAVTGAWRSPADRARDVWRHPMETLRFFGLQSTMTVVEFWPGSGWYAEILAPYLAEGGGTYYAAGFYSGEGADPAQAALTRALRRRLSEDSRLYGEVQFTVFSATGEPPAPLGTADMALFMRSIHPWMAAGIAEKAFADAFAVLKPGGVLGVEQHRLAPDDDQDPAATSGYVQENFVKQLASEAGLIFVASSEINANADDTKDHPFGVDTLPPMRLSAPRGEPADPAFDHTPYDETGESDRMTLKFRKPE